MKKLVLLMASIALFCPLSNGQDTVGDSLLCYSNLFDHHAVTCLAAAPHDMHSEATGRHHKAGDIFRTTCTGEPEERWVLHKTEATNSGQASVQTLRPSLDFGQCLTLNGGKAELSVCESSNPAQAVTFTLFHKTNANNSANYFNFTISSLYDRESKLALDFESDSINAYSSGCVNWIWVSHIQEKAASHRDKEISFPVKGNDDHPDKVAYSYAWVERMLPTYDGRCMKTIMADGVCSNGCPAGDDPSCCFPLDFDLNRTEIGEVHLDLSLKVGGASEQKPTNNRVPTGFYSKPCQTVTIEVGEFDTSKTKIIGVFRVMHYEPAVGQETWNRPPKVIYKQMLKPGVNKLRSAYGGPITLEVIGRDADAANLVAVKIINAAPMATFRLGTTDEQSWAEELKKEPGWIFLQGEHVVGVDLKRPYLGSTFAQVKAAVLRHDLMLKNFYLLSGYDLNETDIEKLHAVPQGWMWWIRDNSHHGGLAGNPVHIYARDANDYFLNLQTWDIWLISHEFGHTMQTPCYSYTFGGESTNNIYTVFAITYFCGDGKFVANSCTTSFGFDLGATWTEHIRDELKSNMTWDQMPGGHSPYELNMLTFFMQMVKAFGFEPMRKMHRLFRERIVDPNDQLCKSGDRSMQYDAVYSTMCKTTGHDLTKHFDTWKIRLSDEVRGAVKAMGYPQPPVDISWEGIPFGTPLAWRMDGTIPEYALPPFKEIPEAQDPVNDG